MFYEWPEVSVGGLTLTVLFPQALFQGLPLGYQTSATYSSFPAHLSRFPEQKISSPERTEQFFSQR